MAEWKDCLVDGDVATIQCLEVVIINILNVLFRLIGIALFVMVLVSGFNYLTAGGNPEKVKKSSASLSWSFIGLLFLIGAWFILRFISQFTGVDVTQFEIPGA